LPTLILLRHGQSQWNLEDRFTGWVDVDLTAQGEAEARKGGELIAAAGLAIDRCFTAVLTRAIRTSWLALAAAGQTFVPEVKDWRLNERHYGALQGLNKAETAQKYGEEQVLRWRRSYDTPPPALDPADERNAASDPRYASLSRDEVPLTECLKDTVARVVPYWQSRIAPRVAKGERVLVAAHGNSLRALIKYLDGLSDQAIIDVNVPTGIPLVYELEGDLRPRRSFYLGDAEAIARAQHSVASQGKAR